ncbi:aromatic ring-hydroxylating dioxygenase subunit alpha [Bradyrhizobium tropiciagri]|uniref:aromatic ring-hydroxylating dioxygenase subunit alpha n=1 Tax=Bradyrhizobium tropiciagri TaxID=312253 RepID=UPI001BA68BE5|nr:aromatic ring-hydroxylating dioxygenase subunit alpha [Bradyrhizobium tropiciagri]MBR0896766.1 aromatic ring-hydroxylating dioxygenase subunit alpha [Bradyrhizobium tropiciagri]
MFIRNNWYIGAWSHEIVPGKLFGRVICDEPILFYRDTTGAVVALEDRCCHRAAPLSLGQLKGDVVQCGYHGLEFDRKGRCVKIPGQGKIPERACVRAYPLQEQDRLVWIWMGDHARESDEAPSRMAWHVDPHFAHKPGLTLVEANHVLISDNLLDLSHVGYVHKRTLGGDPNDHSAAELKTKRGKDHVKVIRIMRATDPGPFHILNGGFKGKVDRYQIIEFRPGFVVIDSGMTEAGKLGPDAEVPDDAFNLRKIVFNGITPETEHKTHYFWSASHVHGIDRPEVIESVFRDFNVTFAEDIAFMEGQYNRRRLAPERELFDINSDVGSIQANLIIARRLAEESGSAVSEAAE